MDTKIVDAAVGISAMMDVLVVKAVLIDTAMMETARVFGAEVGATAYRYDPNANKKGR